MDLQYLIEKIGRYSADIKMYEGSLILISPEPLPNDDYLEIIRHIGEEAPIRFIVGPKPETLEALRVIIMKAMSHASNESPVQVLDDHDIRALSIEGSSEIIEKLTELWELLCALIERDGFYLTVTAGALEYHRKQSETTFTIPDTIDELLNG